MKKYLIFLIGLLFIVSVLAIKPDFQAATVVNPVTGEAKNTVTVPSTAVQVSPSLFYLGTAVDNGMVVEGYAIINNREGFGKPTGCNNDGKCQGWEDSSCADCSGGGNGGIDTSSCYGFLANGAKWKTIEPYIVNSDNTEGLTNEFIINNLALDIGKWETAAGIDILGVSSSVNETLVADLESPDDKNEVYFGDIGQSGAIAITIVWGVFRGPPSQRKLVEWDQVYDQIDFDWSSSGEANMMDFENIATHELGHSFGLDDLYNGECAEQTMYGYADYGETKKRTLENGDIRGVQELYG